VAKGRSLKDLVESGWRVPEEEVKRIAIEVSSTFEVEMLIFCSTFSLI
jgi:hypothetical protein